MSARGRVLLCAVLVASGAGLRAHDLADVYARVESSVVVVETVQRTVDSLFPGQPVDSEGLGSGVLITRDGKVATAAHVVQAADAIHVRFLDGERIAARVLYSSPAADLALIQLERLPQQAHVAELGDSDRIRVGEEVFVVGAPFGISHTMTAGHISGRRTTDDLFGGVLPTEMFQTDAAINQGNSGGPMFDVRGEVIGIVSYIVSQSGGSEGLGFVVTSNMARRLLLEERSLWTGFEGRWVEGELARALNVPGGEAILVEAVARRSPASYLGLRGGETLAVIGDEELSLGGDLILAVQGLPVRREGLEEIRRRWISLQAGEEIRLEVLRAGEVVELTKAFYPDLLLPPAPAGSP